MTPLHASAYESGGGDPVVAEELAEVRIIAATPDITQRVAQVLRHTFRCEEPHSCSRTIGGGGTLLCLTIDTGHAAEEDSVESAWPNTGGISPPTVTRPPPGTGAHAPTPPEGTSSHPVRLVLRPPTFPPGPLCGAWWPRSDDLMAELPALTEVFDTVGGRVTRMASHRDTWPAAPCDLPVTGHTVKAAWFVCGLDPHTIRLFSYGIGRWDLLVVPFRTDAAAAERLMAAATDPALHVTASALMAAERRRRAEEDAGSEQRSVQQWEDEGGAPMPAPAPPAAPSVSCYGPRPPFHVPRRSAPSPDPPKDTP